MTTRTAFVPPVTDGQLVAACIAGEPGAVETLVTRFHPKLIDHLCRHVTLGRVHDAEDLTQEALTKALGHLHGFDQTAPLWPWLRQIAENTARDHYRLARHRREVAAHGLDLDQLLPSGEDHASRQAERDHVVRALRAMSRPHREAVVEVDLKQVPQREAAAMLGISYTALRKRLDRGRTAFRRSYEAAASLPMFQWFTKLSGSKLAASGALSAGLSAAIPVLIITGLALGPDAHSQPRHDAAASTAAGPTDVHPPAALGADPPGAATPPDVSPVAPTRIEERLPAPATSREPDRPAGLASGVQTPDVAAPVGGARTSSEFQDGSGYTTYSVPATDLDGSGPAEISHEEENVAPAHTAACQVTSSATLVDCRPN